ncbi:MAG: hypothetical protein LC637_05280 [Xanthomonadaceae bacterium]|nr:hypothetical protein [Xanthomonadaceae bacterium]
MSRWPNHIRLVAGFEIRPPSTQARYVFERDQAERLGGLIADDLAACVADVRAGHLVIGPALLEPGQVLSPGHAPWTAMREIARLDGPLEPGVTSIGSRQGRLSHAVLEPCREPPQGLFVCLPLLVAVEAARFETLATQLEQVLFERGGLQPPAMGTLADATGLDPVHGQLMTQADLMALVKMQLAGAGLDPFWPPVEHALLAPDQAASLELPAGLKALWNIKAGGWELEFAIPQEFGSASDAWALWLRSWRQTIALLETHLVPWRALTDEPVATVDDANQWVRAANGPADGPNRAWIRQHPEVGLIGYSSIIDGQRADYFPLHAEAIGALKARFAECGIDQIKQHESAPGESLASAHRPNPGQP